MVIRNAVFEDVKDIVHIHCDAFKDFFLTSLGVDFLTFYYSAFIRSNDTVIMVAEINGTVVGFSAAAKVSRGFNNKLIKQNLIRFAWLAITLLFTKPNSLLRLVNNLTKKSDVIVDVEDYAELCSICVDSHFQDAGIGKNLLAKTEDTLKTENVKRISLTTDYNNNESAVGFYFSMGFQISYEFVAYPNRRMYRFIKTL